MTRKKERSVSELYEDDPERADAIVFGRRTDVSRRGFLGGVGLGAMTAAVGGTIVYSSNMPAGLIPAAFAQDAKKEEPKAAEKGPEPFNFPGKDPGLTLLGDKPLVAETPAEMLDDETTPYAKFFIRTSGQIPPEATDRDGWKLTIDGEVDNKLELTLGELKKKFTPKTYRMMLECGGNGRAFFVPAAKGNQWTTGGAGCAEWTGVLLGDVLKAAGLKSSAVYTAHYGTDPHLSGDPAKHALSRGVRIAKALDPNSMIVWAMNGEPLPHIHGGPVRVLIPGWPGSASQKWLTRIWIRDKEHDGQGMTGTSYRVPIKPMVPGGKADPANFKVLESMPVRSIITNPANGTKLAAGTKEVKLRGAAWAGDLDVQRVDVSVDYGATWKPASLGKPKNRYDWVRWTAAVDLPSDGYYEIWSRATDSEGKAQTHVAANWNPSGYGANPFHRIAILVG